VVLFQVAKLETATVYPSPPTLQKYARLQLIADFSGKFPKWFILPGSLVERSEMVRFIDANYSAPLFLRPLSQKFLSVVPYLFLCM